MFASEEALAESSSQYCDCAAIRSNSWTDPYLTHSLEGKQNDLPPDARYRAFSFPGWLAASEDADSNQP
jgi:hypothetical protein